MNASLFTRARVAYLFLAIGLLGTIVAIAVMSNRALTSERVRLLLEHESLVSLLWLAKWRVVLALAVVFVYTGPLYLIGLLLYVYAPAAQKPESPRVRLAVLGAFLVSLAATPALFGSLLAFAN